MKPHTDIFSIILKEKPLAEFDLFPKSAAHENRFSTVFLDSSKLPANAIGDNQSNCAK